MIYISVLLLFQKNTYGYIPFIFYSTAVKAKYTKDMINICLKPLRDRIIMLLVILQNL